MQPAVIDKIAHFPVPWNFESDFASSREPIVRIVLIIFIAISILPYALAVEPLILQLLSDISISYSLYLNRLTTLLVFTMFHSLIIKYYLNDSIMSSTLRYGQVIRIRSYEKANTFLTTKSYTDPNLYFQIYNKEDLLPSASNDMININNYRESLFEVLPKGSFQINDEMNSQKVEVKKAESAPRAKTEQEQFKAIVREKRGKNISFGDKVIFRHFDSQYYIYGSFDCATSGIGAFKIDLKKELSEKIIFQLVAHRTYEKEGDKISLSAPFKIYHCETKCYLSYCFQQLFLDRGFSRQIDHGVLGRNDASFPIAPPKIKMTLKERDDEQGEEGQIRRSNNKSEVMLKSGRYLIINQNIPKRVFKLVPHNEFQMKIKREAIKNHDIVYFIHTENDQYICPDNFGPQIFLKKRLDQPDQTDIFDGLWEIQEIKTIQKKPDDLMSLAKSRTPTRKEPNKKFGNMLAVGGNLGDTYLTATVGNPMSQGQFGAGYSGASNQGEEEDKSEKKKDKYILRHLASGRIMYVSDVQRAVELQDNNKGTRKPLLLKLIDAKLEDGALVQFTYKRRKSDKEKDIVKHFLSALKDGQQEQKERQRYSMQQIQEGYEQQRSYVEDQGSGGNVLNQAYNDKFLRTKLGLVAQSAESAQHGFRIYKASEQVKQLCLFVLSSQEIIFKFSCMLYEYETLHDLLQELTVFLLNNVINVLKSLIGFIYDTDYNKIAESGNNPNAKKQRIFDEVGMIQLITRLLEVIHKRDFEEGDKLHNLDETHKSEYRKIRTVYQLGYKLLESIAVGNTLLKLKISRYLNQKYLKQILIKQNRTVYRSIQEVLDGNILSLQQIDDQYIGALIEQLDPKDPDPADLYFLSRLCLCGEKKVHKNQVAVFKAFYEEQVKQEQPTNKFTGEEEATLAANKFKFRQDQQKMQILSKITPSSNAQYRTLSQLYEECNLMKSEGGYNPDKNHWAYFMQYLNLLADLSVQKNQTPLSYINRNLPLKTLVAFMHESTVKRNLLFQPFIRLVHHAFVETSDYEQISRITKVKYWLKLGDFNIPRAKKAISPDIKKTMTLIFDYIKRINKLPFELKKGGNQLPQIVSEDDNFAKQPQNIELDVDDKNRLTNVKTFLQILKSTLNLGFWPEIDQMKKMVPFLLKVMRFDIEYCDRALEMQKEERKKNNQPNLLTEIEEKNQVYSRIKKQLKLNKPNIVLLVECKILAAKILNIIIDYEFNVRVSIITKHFKDVMEVDVDLSNYAYDKKEFIQKWRENDEYELFAPQNKKEGYLLNQQIWMDKIDEILQERDLFSQCSVENIIPKLAFFETFIYSNQELTNLTLQLIDRVTSQRRQILKTFKDIIFVAGGVLMQLAEKGVESTRSMLLHLTSQTIKEPNVASNEEILSLKEKKGERRMKKEGVVQQLASLTISMMKKSSPVNDPHTFYFPDNLYPFYDIERGPQSQLQDFNDRIRDITVQKMLEAGEADGSFMIITEKDSNLQLNQNLIKSQDHHTIIVDFLEIMKPLPQNYDLPIRALNAAYNFLTVLVWNNNENKKELEGLLKVAQPHLPYNVGCIDFFKQMYTNNKKLVKNKDIKSIIEKIINHANELSLKKYQKSKLLDFLRIAVIFDDKGYDINQNMVMEIISQYQVSSNNQIVYLAEEEKIASSLSSKIAEGRKQWFQTYIDNYELSVIRYYDLDVPPELFYLATFFEIFSALIENQNVVNIGKAENMHPIEFLHKILAEADRCWVVIRHLRSYLNKLYYFQGRKKDSLLFKAFTMVDLPIIKDELLRIAELVCNTPDYHMIKIKNPVRYTYMASYVYLSLEQILHSLQLFVHEPRNPKDRQFQIYLNQIITQDEKRQEVVFNILEIIEYLEYLLKTIDGRYINKYMSKVSKRMRTFVNNIPLDFANRYSEITKAKTVKNIADNNLSSDQIPFKKTYRFHQGKGFWRHLLDWNSFKDQDSQRDKDLNKVQKRVERMPNEPQEAFNNRKRDYTLDLICLGNIDKRIQSKINFYPAPEKKEIKEDNKKDKKQSTLPKNLTVSQSNRFDVKKQKFKNDDEKNIVINMRRKKLVKFIEINPIYSNFSHKEVSQSLYKFFAELRQISAERYHFQVQDKLQIVDCEQVIKSIVKMNEADSNSIRSDYKLLIIQLLTNFIQRTSNVFKQDIDKWFVNDEQKGKINEAQNFLHRCGVASFLSSLIINDLKSSIEMASAILMLGISLLLGRSSQIQKELFDLIKSDDNNLLLGQLNNIVKDCGNSIEAYLVGSEQKEYCSKTINYSDTYDYYIDTQKIMKRMFVYQPETVLEKHQFNQKVINMQYVFIFLKNLCEGNIEIKQYIHEQRFTDEENKIKSESVDFLNLGITELKRMFNKFEIQIIKVPFAIIDFIYQVTQIPCIENQIFICQSTLFSDFAQLDAQINQIIKKSSPNTINKNLVNIFHLYSSNIRIVISCLEGNVPQIYQNLSSPNLCLYYVKIVQFFITHVPTLQGINPIACKGDLAALLEKKQLHQSYYLDMLQVTTVIKKLQTKTTVKGFRETIHQYIKRCNMEEYILLLKDNLLGIQIKVAGMEDSCQTLFFPKHNVFKYLSRATRNSIMDEVDRSTQRDKIIGLISAQEMITEEIEYSYYLDNEYKIFNIPLSITTQRVEKCMSWGLTVAAIICLLMLYFATVVYYPYSENIEYDLGPQEWLLKIISMIQFVIAMTYFFLWMKSHMKLSIQKYQRMKREAEEQRKDGQEVETKLMSLFFKIPGCKGLYCLKEDGQFGTMILFMFGSLMGMFYKIQWYSLLLMNLLMARLDVLGSIIQAIKTSIRMLGILSFFGVSFVAFFSVFSMGSYVQTIYPDRYPDTHCQSVIDCVLELYIREQIGEDMEVFKGGRFAYDMIYLIFMDTLFGNILGGVLIDNFASLRAQKEDMLKDKTEKCFICGIDKQALEKKSQDLKTHYIQQNHKLWNYVFYLYYLDKQSKKTGLEEIIKQQVLQENVGWIPEANGEQTNLSDMLSRLQELVKEQQSAIEATNSKEE